MKLKFYEVDSEYIKYLKENGDKRIPNIEYEKHKKIFCGIVLTILIILHQYLLLIKRRTQHF